MVTVDDLPIPLPEFQSLGEAAVAEALRDPDKPNHISFEIGRLMAGYIEAVRHHGESHSVKMANFLSLTPRWPIEALAKQLTEGIFFDPVIDYRHNWKRRFLAQPVGRIDARSALRAVSVFDGASDAAIDTLLEASTVCAYKKGEPLITRGTRAASFYIVIDGAVEIYRDAFAGDQASLDVCTAADFFGGSVASLWDNADYPYSAKAVTDSQIIAVPAEAIKELERSFPDVTIRLTQALWKYVERQRLEDDFLSLYWAPKRVGCLLLRLIGKTDGQCKKVYLPYSEPIVSLRMGMKPEMFSRALVQLKSIGVEVKNDTVMISDNESLIHFSCANCPAVNANCFPAACAEISATSSGTQMQGRI